MTGSQLPKVPVVWPAAFCGAVAMQVSRRKNVDCVSLRMGRILRIGGLIANGAVFLWSTAIVGEGTLSYKRSAERPAGAAGLGVLAGWRCAATPCRLLWPGLRRFRRGGRP